MFCDASNKLKNFYIKKKTFIPHADFKFNYTVSMKNWQNISNNLEKISIYRRHGGR